MIGGSKGLHHGSGAQEGEMAAVTTFHGYRVHHPLARDANLQPRERSVTIQDRRVIQHSFHGSVYGKNSSIGFFFLLVLVKGNVMNGLME